MNGTKGGFVPKALRLMSGSIEMDGIIFPICHQK